SAGRCGRTSAGRGWSPRTGATAPEWNIPCQIPPQGTVYQLTRRKSQEETKNFLLGDRRSDAALPFPLLKVLLDLRLPVGAQRDAGAHGGHRPAHRLIVQPGARAVAAVGGRPVPGDAQARRRLHRVYVGPQEEELPAVPLPLPPDHRPDLPGGIAA